MDTETVKRIAHLARIEVADGELELLADEIGAIIGWVEQLDEVDTSGVEPMTSVAELTLPRRADEVTDGGLRDDVLANAPEHEKGFYTVPKVVE
ncbi:MAG: Asp-tRNA(Asn)/Glu-tRNA(Gln) amidotransferase subunit GatC [Proteobacteria bacterium]|nr:Asp-tRNA(Asn)/Glu-tRNA(Gln) amidotransferase subunit GatC [Pseudomonadota bacterium]